MKKIITLSLMLLTWFAAAGQVKIENVEIKRSGNTAEITFDALVDKKATGRNYKLIVTPTLENGGRSVKLPPIVVESRRRRIMDSRNGVILPLGAFPAENGSTVKYHTSVNFENWFTGGRILVGRLSVGCCSENTLSQLVSTENLKVITPNGVSLSIGGMILILEKNASLPSQYATQYVAGTPKRVAETLVDDLKIDFAVGSARLDVFRLQNYRELSNLINVLRSSKDVLDGKITITGYASPEGQQDLNLKLAYNRAIAVRNYILDNVPYLRPSNFDIVNGGENWQGLAKILEESNMPGRWQVIDIIERTPPLIDYTNNSSRKKYLMDINGGQTWKYMLTNIFPKLRNAASVTVYKKFEGGTAPTTEPAYFPVQNESIINRAIDSISERNAAQAMALLQQVDTDPRAWNPLGVCYILDNNILKAVEYFQKSADAGYPDAKANLEQVKF